MSSAQMSTRWACLGLLCACAAQLGKFVWAEDYAESPAAEYVIAPGDVIMVRVFTQDNMSGRVRVRSDGKVSLPFLNDVEAAGQTPSALARDLQARLKSFINAPVVTVSLEETRPLSVSVLGEVAKPGAYPFETGAGVLQALASAGGMTEYAHKDRIFVLRQETVNGSGADPPPARIRFTYEALSRAEGKAGTFRLKVGDVVVVE
jgi:polysaccharide biosynthesis/export protein